MKIDGETHWFLEHKFWRIRLDPSRLQFTAKQRKELDSFGPDGLKGYDKAVGSGFLTKKPSKRARKLIKELTWQAQ